MPNAIDLIKIAFGSGVHDQCRPVSHGSLLQRRQSRRSEEGYGLFILQPNARESHFHFHEEKYQLPSTCHDLVKDEEIGAHVAIAVSASSVMAAMLQPDTLK
jgi:hypothetical protein